VDGRKIAGEDAAIDEDEAVTKLTTEVELRTDEDKAVVTTEVELRTDEVPKLTAEVEFKMDVKLGLKFVQQLNMRSYIT
jgi:hypothetical protein